jgi:hypothetical protein
VLVHDHAAQRLDIARDPNRVVDRKLQLARLGRTLLADSVIRRLDGRKNIIGRLWTNDAAASVTVTVAKHHSAVVRKIINALLHLDRISDSPGSPAGLIFCVRDA